MIKRKYDSRRARVNIERRRATHYKFVTGMDFRTRTHGTARQIGKKFPVGSISSKSLPKLTFKKPTRFEKARLTELERDAIREEEKLKAAGFKGYMIGIRLKSGKIEEIPLIAKSWHEAFALAHENMMKYDPNDIDEITIVDPSLKEIAHAISGGARRFAGAIKRGVEKIPGYARKTFKEAEAFTIRRAREAGRIAALPEEVREAYEVGKARRPGIVSASVEEPARRVLTPEEASRLVAEAMRGAPITEAAKAEVREEPAPYTTEELKAAQERIARRRAERRQLTPSEQKRRYRASTRPFQSRMWGSNDRTSSTSSEEESRIAKTKRQLRKARHALRVIGALG
jgi:hypothetical protein